MIFADKLIQLRKKSGWSQEELANQMNVTRQSVSKWEAAQSIPDLEKILKLSELFGLTEDQKLHTVVAFGYPSHISRIENVEKDGDIRYHLDEDRNYVVPKRNLEDVVTCI